MKVEAIKAFIDKNTRERVAVGAVLDFDKDRAESAAARGLVKILPETKKATKKKAEPKAEEAEK